MKHDPIGVLQHLSANLRAARLAAGLSQDALAKASGVSRRMLVSLEGGDANVSFVTLDRLAHTLGVSFAELIRPTGIEAGEQPVLAWRGVREGSRAYLLQSLRIEQGALELWEWRLAPGERYTSQPDGHGFQEMFYVADGVLTLETEQGRSRWNCGQSHSFASDQTYAYLNEGDGPCTFVKNVVAVYR